MKCAAHADRNRQNCDGTLRLSEARRDGQPSRALVYAALVLFEPAMNWCLGKS
jgi:hypothetical protein